jgi:hypothetical protein
MEIKDRTSDSRNSINKQESNEYRYKL